MDTYVKNHPFTMSPRHLVILALAALLAPSAEVSAFPPAPDHVIYGTVRDELGNPLRASGANVVLTTSSGVEIKTRVYPTAGSIKNYVLNVPVDSGLTAAPYKPTAVQPTVPFRLIVRIGTTDYLPIEMIGDFKNLGEASEKSRIDLTLGEDTDRDGLPDAWERNLLKPGQTLADITAGDDTDGDGLSNRDEYYAGTYAFDSDHDFSLEIAGFDAGQPLLDFTAIPGRTYGVFGSDNLKSWTPISFTIPAEGANSEARTSYRATDVRLLRIRAEATDQASFSYFKISVR